MKTMAITDLTLAHRIFVNYTREIDPKFITHSVDNFGIRVEKVGFNYPKAATTHINNLVSGVQTYIIIYFCLCLNRKGHFDYFWMVSFYFILFYLENFIRVKNQNDIRKLHRNKIIHSPKLFPHENIHYFKTVFKIILKIFCD